MSVGSAYPIPARARPIRPETAIVPKNRGSGWVGEESTRGRDLGRLGERGLSEAALGAWEGGDDFGAGCLEGRSVVRAARRLLVTGGDWSGADLGSFSWGSLIVNTEVSLRSNVPRIGVTSDGQDRDPVFDQRAPVHDIPSHPLRCSHYLGK